eukprot:g2489.t1
MQVDQLVLLFEKLFEDLGHIVRFLRSFSFLAVGPLKSLSLIHKQIANNHTLNGAPSSWPHHPERGGEDFDGVFDGSCSGLRWLCST